MMAFKRVGAESGPLTDLLTVKDLWVRFRVHGGIIDAVKGVNFQIRQGSTIALVGESGSGKSVISQCIMGILPSVGEITGGELLFADPDKPGEIVDIAQIPQNSAKMRALRGGRISIIFQEPMTSLSQLHTIGDQICEALHLHRDVSKAEGVQLVTEILRLVGFPNPTGAIKMFPFELSGGLRQRAMIAMALVCHPALLIADEPTTALDVSIQAQILKLIRSLQHELGMAVLMITHDLGVVANVAEDVVVMYHGEIMERGTIQDIYEKPQHPYLKGLMNAVPHFGMKPGQRLVPLREIKHQASATITDKEPWPESADTSGPLLDVRNVVKRYTTKKGSFFGSGKQITIAAVNDVSFQIKRGECFGLVGESGSGKTSVSKLVMRAVTPDEGEIVFNDRGSLVDILKLEGKDLLAFRRKVQMVFQDPFGSLNPRMTVFDVIREPLIIHDLGDTGKQRATVQELMHLVGLDPRFLNRYPHSFSGGQRQRIGIARALALKPNLLICDEPVSALDVSIQAQILNLFKDMQAELGLTYLFISHNLAVVDYVADRIAVMCRGQIVEIAPREVFFKNPVHHYTRSLMAAVPYPNLERKLDFDALGIGSISDPMAWPKPFAFEHAESVRMHNLGDDHFVLADADAAMEKYR
ncbi:MAG: Glutathione import ATP-binding protein GsiA [Alphaproteobacteria bacterium MarineAlpha4_Bin2]|nr:MAG: Glutathione import ATP-binding protein GsiA [Alphaproteobacteria bacterium MarineAlpha4_Bin2]